MLFFVNHSLLKKDGPNPGHNQEGWERLGCIRTLLQGLHVGSLAQKGEHITVLASGSGERCLQIAREMQEAFHLDIVVEPLLGGPDYEPLSESPKYVKEIAEMAERLNATASGHKIACCRRQALLGLYKAWGLDPQEIKGGSIFEVDPVARTIRCIRSGNEGIWRPLRIE